MHAHIHSRVEGIIIYIYDMETDLSRRLTSSDHLADARRVLEWLLARILGRPEFLAGLNDHSRRMDSNARALGDHRRTCVSLLEDLVGCLKAADLLHIGAAHHTHSWPKQARCARQQRATATAGRGSIGNGQHGNHRRSHVQLPARRTSPPTRVIWCERVVLV